MRSFLGVILLAISSFSAAITVQDIPQCAQDCLANSTTAQKQCAVIDVACLCTNSAYVSSLSCCLATQCTTSEQQTAVQFNQQECNAVNESAPNFVGCSPLGLPSSIVIGGTANSTDSIATATGTTSSIPVTTDASPISTISGSPLYNIASLSGSKTSTATFAGKPLLTGSCTSAYFALVTDPGGMMVEYPGIGCALGKEDCCPDSTDANAAITKCPQDYFTTANGCCPLGFQVYYTALGSGTPCYSMPLTTFIPEPSPTISGLTLITDHVFAHKFTLLSSKKGRPPLPLGGEIGIIVNAVLFVLVIIAVWFYLRRRKARRLAAALRATTFPPEEPALSASDASPTHELASPEMQSRPARVSVLNWPMLPTSSPPSYEKSRLVSSKVSTPQELPGSTFIHEHHPAFTPQETNAEISPSPPKTPATPTRSPEQSEVTTPVVSPSSSAVGTRSPPVISPLNSPKLPT